MRWVGTDGCWRLQGLETSYTHHPRGAGNGAGLLGQSPHPSERVGLLCKMNHCPRFWHYFYYYFF